MKVVFVISCLGVLILSSCTSSQDKRTLSQAIHAEEVRSLQEIKSHSRLLIDRHPEINSNTKDELKSLLDNALARQQSLKDEESKIVQLLLSKSLRMNQLTNTEVKSKNDLKQRLKDVYQEKSDNVLMLVNKIVILSEQDRLNDGFRNDMIELIRDFR